MQRKDTMLIACASRWEHTGIILSQKLKELPVWKEQNLVDCIYAVQDPKLSCESKTLEV